MKLDLKLFKGTTWYLIKEALNRGKYLLCCQQSQPTFLDNLAHEVLNNEKKSFVNSLDLDSEFYQKV